MDASTVIPAEFEKLSDAILIGYGVAQPAYLTPPLVFMTLLDACRWACRPAWKRLKAPEDVPKDVESYTDSAGNTYEYGFGLSCSGEAVK